MNITKWADQTLYRVTNLSELQQMIDDVRANAEAHAHRKVHLEEILVQSQEYTFVEATAVARKLTDGSVVYDLNF